ncbi:hypothetical protein THIOKS1500019 [Thiocapsa sp. KS1]|nr:hypothetical protein THIOKS1500019 [Thiocapsa sp. KS1]
MRTVYQEISLGTTHHPPQNDIERFD